MASITHNQPEEHTMDTTTTNNNNTTKTIVFLSRGIDDERATVAWTLANAGVANGQDVTVFAVSAGVDVLRKGAVDRVQMNPHDPSMKELVDKFMTAGGTVWACPPCSALRGYTEEDFIDGVAITGAGPVYELIAQGAATICL
jgi:predicted peroxiredoxin